jgi:hypothetical protein
VSWQSADAPTVGAEPAANVFDPESSDAQTSGSQSNDERLKADKPPHWG